MINPGTAIRLVKAGFSVYGIDYEGHGKSSGLQGYISSFDNVVDDCSNFFTGICGKYLNMTGELKLKSLTFPMPSQD